MIRGQHFILAFSFFILASSCDKEWVCKCQTVKDGDVYVIIKKAKEKEAEEVCTKRADLPMNNSEVNKCVLQGKYSSKK